MIPKCMAQQSTPNVTYDEYGWTSDMKKVAMTTQDIGLTFKITIYNNSTEPFDSASHALYVYINVVNNAAQSYNILSKIFTFDSTNELYLPPSEPYVFFVKVKNGYSDTPLAIGSYTADLSYSNYALNYGVQGTPIGQYPFNFQVETQDALNQAIQNKGGGPTIVIPVYIQITLEGGISLSVVVGVAIYLWKRKKK